MQLTTALAVLLGRFEVSLAPQMGGWAGCRAKECALLACKQASCVQLRPTACVATKTCCVHAARVLGCMQTHDRRRCGPGSDRLACCRLNCFTLVSISGNWLLFRPRDMA